MAHLRPKTEVRISDGGTLNLTPFDARLVHLSPGKFDLDSFLNGERKDQYNLVTPTAEGEVTRYQCTCCKRKFKVPKTL